MRLLFLSGLLFASAAVAGEARSVPDPVDLAALYYYAQHGQQDRVEAEAARLRLKYPDFVMPADLHAPAGGQADESALWTLYEADDFAGIDAEIGRRRAEDPAWAPSEDFSAKLARRKLRAGMTAAAARADWPGVVAAAGDFDPATETEVDLVWTLIDAAVETGAGTLAEAAYRGLLSREGAARLPDGELVTTLRKAVRDLPAGDLRQMLSGLGLPAAEAGPIERDLARREVADFNADAARQAPLAEATLARLREAPEAADLSLLGWYDLKTGAAASAEQRFRTALAGRRDAENAKGLYLSLAAQDRQDDAYGVARTHLQELAEDPQFLMNALSARFAEPGEREIDAGIVSAYSNAILAAASADHAEILAWYAYNSRQYDAAKAWFGKALDWESAPARVKGLALSLMRLGDKAGSAALEAEYRDIYPAVWAEIGKARPSGKGGARAEKPAAAGYLAAFKAKRYGACVEALAALEARDTLPADAQLVKGWCHFGLDRLVEARKAFEAALGDARTRPDAAYGAVLTLLRGRLTDEAEAVAGLYPLTQAQEREVRAEIHLQRARSAFDHKQYRRVLDALNARMALVAEPIDLSQLRGWAHYHLGNRREARAIFERLDMHLHDTAAAGGIAATAR